MRGFFLALIVASIAVCATTTPRGACALSLSRGEPTPLTLDNSVLEVHSTPDAITITAAYDAAGHVKTGLNIPAESAQYDVYNSITVEADVAAFTVYYDPILATKIIGASVPLGNLDSLGNWTYLGGNPYLTLFNAGFRSYNYNTGAPWTIEYASDQVTFKAASGVHALPWHHAVGETDIGGHLPTFTIYFYPEFSFGPVWSNGWAAGAGSPHKGNVLGLSGTPPAKVDIAGAKQLEDLRAVEVSGKIITGVFPSADYFYMEEPDRNAGIRVRIPKLPTESARYVTVDGVLGTQGFEREIYATSVNVGVKAPEVKPLEMTNKTLGGSKFGFQPAIPEGGVGLNNVGLLVKTTGRVTGHLLDAFYIDDGSNLSDALYPGLTIKSPNSIAPFPPVGSRVTVVGESGADVQPRSGRPMRVLRPRGAADIQVLARPVAFVHRYDLGGAAEVKNLLDANGFSTALLTVAESETEDFSNYSMIIIGDDTGSLADWGTPAAVAHINGSGLPILGISEGGYAFFGKLGLAIGYHQGWHGPADSVYVMNPASSIYTTPNAITVPVNRILKLYANAVNKVAIYFPSIPSNVEAIGRETESSDHYPLVRQDNRYMLWGYGAPMSSFTPVGTSLFINAVTYNLQ